MNGLLVRIAGSRRHWRVVRDNGDKLWLRWGSEHRTAHRADVTDRFEPGIGWVPTDTTERG